MKTLKGLLRNYRKSINPPYKLEDLWAIIATFVILFSIPLTVMLVNVVRELTPRAVDLGSNVSLKPAWTATYNGKVSGRDVGEEVALDSNRNVYAVGTYKAKRGYNVWLRKYKPNKRIVWTRIYNGKAKRNDFGKGVAVDSANNVVVVGSTYRPGKKRDIFVRKYTRSGKVVWTRFFNGSSGSHDQAEDVAVDKAGNIYVIGFAGYSGAGKNIWIRKYTRSGRVVWTKVFTTPNPSSADSAVGSDDRGFGISVSGDGFVYAVGQEDHSAQGSGKNLWLAKLSLDGNTVWVNRYDSSDKRDDVGFSVAADNSGNSYVVGRTIRRDSDGVYRTNSIIQKYNSGGNKSWEKISDTKNRLQESLLGAALNPDSTINNLYVIGTKERASGDKDIWLSAYSPGGSLLWEGTRGSRDRKTDIGRGVAVLKSGSAYTVGSVVRDGRGANIWLRKYKNVDSIAPIVSITSPSSGSTVSGVRTIQATAADKIEVARVRFFIDDIARSSDSSAPYSYSWDTRNYSNGTHRLRAEAFDTSGNKGVSATITVTVSNGTSQPAGTITLSGASNCSGSTPRVSLSWTKTTNDTSFYIVKDGTVVAGATGSSWVSSETGGQTHSWRVRGVSSGVSSDTVTITTVTCIPTGAKLPPCGSYGDVNLDGFVSSVDSDWVLQYAAGTRSLNSTQRTNADVNGNGTVNSIDANIILQYLEGKITTFSAVCRSIS